MADCYAPEMDDLHRRWLPREIFADIGIADAAAPAAAAAAEDISVHLTAGVLGVGGGKAAAAPFPPPPPGPALFHRQQHHHHAAQICGMEGRVLVAYGGGSNGGSAAAAAAAWPFLPYSPLQWQVATNFGGGGGVPVPWHAPLRPCHGPPPAKRRLGGTGVFLPRAEVYQYQHKAEATKSPAEDVKPTKQQQQRRDEEATGRKQQWQQAETAAAEMMQQQNASAALLALPQEWTY